MLGMRSFAGGSIIVLSALTVAPLLPGDWLSTAQAGGPPVQVEGYFCDAKADQLAFLDKKVGGDNEIMASNAVNKAVGKASCMPYIIADAVPTSEQTVMHNGYVFVLRSYKFLPENVERWHGTVAGALQQNAQKHDI